MTFWKRYRVPATAAAKSRDWSRQSDSPAGKRSQQSTGFLGPTSYWADLDGNEGASPKTVSTLAVSMSYSEYDGTNSLGQDQVERGARILSLLFEDLSFYDSIICLQLESCCMWIIGSSIVSGMFNALRELRDRWLASKTHPSPDDLAVLSRTIFENSITPVEKCGSTTMVDYVSATIARWESIGLLFSSVGLAVASLPRGHKDLRYDANTVVDPEKLKVVCAEIVETCLAFCDTGVLNDSLCCLLFQQVTLLTEAYGDSGMFSIS